MMPTLLILMDDLLIVHLLQQTIFATVVTLITKIYAVLVLQECVPIIQLLRQFERFNVVMDGKQELKNVMMEIQLVEMVVHLIDQLLKQVGYEVEELHRVLILEHFVAQVGTKTIL